MHISVAIQKALIFIKERLEKQISKDYYDPKLSRELNGVQQCLDEYKESTNENIR